MEITINVVEAASELAHIDLQEFWEENYPNVSYEIEDNGVTSYTEDAQDFFNGLYDFYFTLLTNCSTELNGKD